MPAKWIYKTFNYNFYVRYIDRDLFVQQILLEEIHEERRL